MPFFPSGAVSGQLVASVLAAFLSRRMVTGVLSGAMDTQ